MSLLCDCCCSKKRTYVIYLVGSKNDQDSFLRNVLNIQPIVDSYIEYKLKHSGLNLVIQSCANGEKEINDLHSSMASGVVYLSNNETPIPFQRKALFVCVGKKPAVSSYDNVIVSYMADGNYENAKEGFSKLISMVKVE